MIRHIANITLDDKKYHLSPPLLLSFDIYQEGQYWCAENKTLSILEYETTENRALEMARESFERRCRFYKDEKTEFTEDQKKMKEIFSHLEFEEGHIDEEVLGEFRVSQTETGTDNQSTGKVDIVQAVTPLPAPSKGEYTPVFGPKELSSDYYRGFIEGYNQALKEWKEVVIKLVEKMD
jgi:hypothetical protein